MNNIELQLVAMHTTADPFQLMNDAGLKDEKLIRFASKKLLGFFSYLSSLSMKLICKWKI